MPYLLLYLPLFVGMSIVLSRVVIQPATMLEQQQNQATTDLAEATRVNNEIVRLYEEARYDEALALAMRVLELRERHLTADDEMIGTSVLNIAEIYFSKRAFVDSHKFYLRVLEIYEKRFGPNSRKVASVLTRLAVANIYRSKYSESEANANPALSTASIAAAYQARFTPTKLSGQPVKVTGVITYNFVRR